MARFVGIEISATHVRAVALTTSYRRTVVDRLVEIDRSQEPDLTQALKQAAGSMLGHGESVAVAFDGAHSYVQHVELPKTALRQLDQVVPFELESRVPVDIDELVHDYLMLRRKKGDDAVHLLVAAAPVERVRAVLECCRNALGRDVE